MLTDIQAEEVEEIDINAQSSGEAIESEDDAQKLTLLEIDGASAARDMRRLQPIERALKKIEDGTYGLSDISGKPISIERLEAIPDAILTATEENLNHSSL